MTGPIVSEYTVAAFQQDDRNGHHWRIQVRRRVDGWWEVHHCGMWLQHDGTWYPHSGVGTFLADEQDAIERAQAALRDLDINGTTWDDMVQRWGVPA